MSNELSYFNLNGTRTEVCDAYAREQIQEIIGANYPVGSIYLTINNVNPTNLFGGTWSQIKDKFLLCAGDTYAGGSTGGSADSVVVSHSHTVNAHTHTVGAHSHGLNSHKHTISGHTHTFSGSSAHTHASSTGRFIEAVPDQVGRKQVGSQGTNRGYAATSYSTIENDAIQFKPKTASTTVTISGTTGTGGSGTTGTATGSTANSTAFNSGSSSPTTNVIGEIGVGKNMPPYLTVYAWIRTA